MSPSQPSRAPRKSASYLSLRQGIRMPSASDDTPGPSRSTRLSYFEVYPKPKSAPSEHSVKPKSRRPEAPHKVPSLPNGLAFSHRDGRDSKRREEPSYVFPSLDSEEDSITSTVALTPKAYSRTRSRTSPSSKSQWSEVTAVPRLCFSGSSSTQHTETPPETPVDAAIPRDSFDGFPVLVAAPVAGVETMDALVDGMNGGDVTQDFPSLLNRSRFGVSSHHPLYQPPLPTPPPGVILGGGKARRRKKSPPNAPASDSDAESDSIKSRPSRRLTRKTSSRIPSNSTVMPTSPSPKIMNLGDENSTSPPNPDPFPERSKIVVPSISEIIRNHAPQQGQNRLANSTVRSPSVYSHSLGHTTVHDDHDSEPEDLNNGQEIDLVSRSSIDSVADEVQKTLRTQLAMKPSPAPPSSFPKRHSAFSDNASLFSPRSDPGGGSSVYSLSVVSNYAPSSPSDIHFLSAATENKTPSSQVIAQYLRSVRLTTLLKLTRSPHASQDNPLTVSLSDLGSQNGFPIVVFLGLGCVRHIMGLYDEMAEFLGLRLITIDRWGLGRTEPRSKSAKGIMQWASVVEEVLDLLRIGQCSVLAHSAGAPYALSFANKLPARIRGNVCLLAPWVGGSENSGYKWLKYVPNGILKTAQAADWKIQAWMIGKPPTITYEGIGYNVQQSIKSSQTNGRSNPVYPSQPDVHPRPSMGSSSFSEYDDLGDFEGRFESRSTLGASSHTQSPYQSRDNKFFTVRPKSSRGFLERLKGSSPQSSMDEKHSGKKLKALRSMGSLKGKTYSSSRKSNSPSPQIPLPPPLQIEVGLGLDDLEWAKSVTSDKDSSSIGTGPTSRSSGCRSISFSSPKNPLSVPSSPTPSAMTSSCAHSITSTTTPQMTLSNALIAASHAESAKGTHNDLLQILNHDNRPWGFSYSTYPHKVRVWYGDKDEKIAENAVRWMERTMGSDRCSVKVVKGADHALMYNTRVVLEVFDYLLSTWNVSEPVGRRPTIERR
ncbi:hypothetical protein AX17_000651 [Amanita inopinata Kibby_2008]|nr:hypothetical protein AX17_000651 [Amanita inopinata Kibby_2008]